MPLTGLQNVVSNLRTYNPNSRKKFCFSNHIAAAPSPGGQGYLVRWRRKEAMQQGVPLWHSINSSYTVEMEIFQSWTRQTAGDKSRTLKIRNFKAYTFTGWSWSILCCGSDQLWRRWGSSSKTSATYGGSEQWANSGWWSDTAYWQDIAEATVGRNQW